MATATVTKERPILFSGEMVRAILDGRKVQTRRVVKPQPPYYINELHGNKLSERAPYQLEHYETGAICGMGFEDDSGVFYKYPYGQPGDRLWVRETWAVHGLLYDDLPPSGIHCSVKGGCWEPGDSIWYQADGDGWPATGKCEPLHRGKWRPSIHMPRWASRITLEVTDVRVERVQEIDHHDAQCEGVEMASDDDLKQYGYKAGFKQLWDSITDDATNWAANPWVWVVSFEVVS